MLAAMEENGLRAVFCCFGPEEWGTVLLENKLWMLENRGPFLFYIDGRDLNRYTYTGIILKYTV